MSIYDMFLFHGHGDGDVGACGNGYKELDIVKTLQSKILNNLKPYNLNIHANNGENNYNKDLTRGNEYKESFGLILHVNSGGGSGCEAIVPLNEMHFTLETNILYRLEELGFKNRGLKSRNYDTEVFERRVHNVKSNGTDWYKETRQCWNRMLSATILEIGFIDSKEDTNLIFLKMDEIAKIISDEIINYLNLKLQVPVCPYCGK